MSDLPTDAFFSDFGGQAPRAGGSFPNPGAYIICIKALKRMVSSNPSTKGHQLFIGELQVLQVETAFEADPGNGQPDDGWAASNKAGEQVAFIQNTTKHGDTAYSNVKGLLLAIMRIEDPNMQDGTITPEQWRQVLLKATEPPGTLMKGKFLRMRVSKTRLRNGKPFSPVVFEPVDQTLYAVAA